MECLGQSLPSQKLKQNCRDVNNTPQCPPSDRQEHPVKSNKQVSSRSPPSQHQLPSLPNPKNLAPQNLKETGQPDKSELVIFRRHEYESKSFTELYDLHSGVRSIRSQAQIKYTLSDFNQIANFGSFMVNVSSIPAKTTYKEGEWKPLDQGKLCSCERSECLQKYCVCYQKGKECSLECLCKNCKNDKECQKTEKEKRSKGKEKEEEAGKEPEPRSVKLKKSIEKVPHKNAKVQEVRKLHEIILWMPSAGNKLHSAMSMPQLQKLIHICILNQSTLKHFYHPTPNTYFPAIQASSIQIPSFLNFSHHQIKLLRQLYGTTSIILTIKISFLISMDKFTKNYIDDIVKPMLNRIELLQRSNQQLKLQVKYLETLISNDKTYQKPTLSASHHMRESRISSKGQSSEKRPTWNSKTKIEQSPAALNKQKEQAHHEKMKTKPPIPKIMKSPNKNEGMEDMRSSAVDKRITGGVKLPVQQNQEQEQISPKKGQPLVQNQKETSARQPEPAANSNNKFQQLVKNNTEILSSMKEKTTAEKTKPTALSPNNYVQKVVSPKSECNPSQSTSPNERSFASQAQPQKTSQAKAGTAVVDIK